MNTARRYRLACLAAIPAAAGICAAGSGGGASGETSAAAVGRRRREMLAAAAKVDLNLRAKNPKAVFPFILARLAADTADDDCIAYLPRGAAYGGKGAMFGISSLSRILGGFRNRLPDRIVNAVRDEVTAYPHFLDGGTENHRAMKRTAGLIFGEQFPGATFHHGITGRELTRVCTAYVRDYGRTIYAASMREYLSPVYHAANTVPWVNAMECSRDPAVRLMARAIVDWMMADLAANVHHGIIVPPLLRCKAMLKGQPGMNATHLSYTMTTAWLYWGGGAHRGVSGDDIRPATSPEHAAAAYLPHPAIRSLGAKRVALPFTLLQARAGWGTIEPAAANPYGYAVRTVPEIGPPQPRQSLRNVYMARRYALGSGNFRENIHNSGYRTMIPFGAVWQSTDDYNWLTVGHPYYYVGYTPEPWKKPSPEDMWSGVSPFQQTVHYENAAILLYDIPDRDPYRDAKLRWGPHWARPARRTRPINACFAYYPTSVDEKTRSAAGFFLREGDVYVAVRPLRNGAAWRASRIPGYARIDMPGSPTGCVVEMGDADEYGSFERFQQAVAKAALDRSALRDEKRVVYRSTRGHRLEIRHRSDGWLPAASVGGVALDFDRWPAAKSPCLQCRDRVLDVNDGRTGLEINWQGPTPVYTGYRLEDGGRTVTGREYLGADGTLVREKQQ